MPPAPAGNTNPAMHAILARHAARLTPRYTSYPTAPHFQADFPEATYRAWLAATDPAAPVSLYLHVPYCARMCWYCGCNMKLAARYEPVAAYVETLLREIDLVAEALPGRLAAGHLHWGGGTPTALAPGDLARVMHRLEERFAVPADAERAIESDPRTLSDAMIETIGRLGFTRASFGVQEFDPAVQAAINRIQPPEMVARAVGGLRAAGVAGINFDLIYGLPHQTTRMLEETIRISAELGADRVALFGYAHVPWVAPNQRMIPADALPGPEARAEQAAAAAEALERAGYVAIGIDHYARPHDPLAEAARTGRLRRNFQGYTTDTAETLIGLGVTAIGRTPAGYVQNIAETGAWGRAVAAGHLPVARGRALAGDDRLRAHVIERLMCDGRVDCAAAARRFGAAEDWATEPLSALAPLAAEGAIAIHGGHVALAPWARPLARVAAAAFDRYLGSGGGRHAASV
ncbi:oxygen-independent coproporphyrinogen III oxidase [Allostella sp. ATCC 35155]|nr:oxygen-independent coproporphyrinogen III oxidase [Stella sp. ATCC 35155]